MLAGILCLLGQGILLFVIKSGVEMPLLPQPLLFVLLSVGLIVTLAILLRRRSPNISARQRFWRLFTMAASVSLLGLGFMILLIGSKAPNRTEDESSILSLAEDDIADLVPSLQEWWYEAGPHLQSTWPAETSALDVPDGDIFRALAPSMKMWQTDKSKFELGIVLWRGSDRLAWAGTVEPLPGFKKRGSPLHTEEWLGELTLGRRGWVLRRWLLWQVDDQSPPGVLEVQMPLTSGLSNEIAPGVELAVGPLNNPVLTMDESGLMIRSVNFGPGTSGPHAHLLARSESAAARRGVIRAKLLLGLMLAWACALLGWTRLCMQSLWGMVALWLGRGLMAVGSGLSWVGAAFPQQNFPAAPDSWFALADPAYFATPFAAGWFASTADAMLTAVLVAGTVWFIIRRRGLVSGGTAEKEKNTPSVILGPGLIGALVFGGVGGGMLLLLAQLAHLVAQNANPRLIGVGISISSISFWGLQIVLLLFAYAFVALLTSFIVGRRQPESFELRRWILAGILSGAAAVAVISVGGGDWWSGRLLGAVIVAGLWFVAPVLQFRPRFLRRYAWPFVMLLAVSWNYTALREVYDAAERTWLEARGDQITEADPAWTRFLLGSVLDDMVVDDYRNAMDRRAIEENIWKDEAAWHLYSESALSDLGYSCSVEIIDSQDREESFFALGFLHKTQYELSDRGDKVDMSGAPVADGVATFFRTERRKYQGGEEEVLTAETPRRDGRGWLRVELPVRSWRISTLSKSVSDGNVSSSGQYNLGQYRPRSEIDRPVLLVLADDTGWLDAGQVGIPSAKNKNALEALRAGSISWADIEADGASWLCLWKPLPKNSARSSGEGFLLGLRQSRWHENALDLSRLMLLDMALLFVFFISLQLVRRLLPTVANASRNWRPGFQERFLAGYLFLGLVLLVVVGM
ncbi:MAG: hypothetical protein ACI9UQ_002508, partial [Candidatus Krumholzibacteriia bacterium]